MTIGIHPYHADDLYNGTSSLGEVEEVARLLLSDTADTGGVQIGNGRTLVAFGEIGLDYFYLERADKETQQKAFQDQLELATRFDLPLFLHVRDAVEDFISIITPYLGRMRQRGVVHSFAGTKSEMLRLIDLGFDISLNGVSFRTEEHLEMVRAVPIDRLQLETDAPWCEIDMKGIAARYLEKTTPPPPSRKHGKFVKGEMVKGRNESCVIDKLAMIVAGIKGVSLEEVAVAAWANSVRMFGLDLS